jgi:hypothetical protein
VAIHAKKLLPAGVAPLPRTSSLGTCDEFNECSDVSIKIS